MKIFDLSNVKRECAGIVAFGFFDSIHVGHQLVIKKAVELAKQNDTISSVFLFKNNIFSLLGIEKRPIFTFSERLEFIRTLHVDRVFYVDADLDYLSLSPTAFLSDLKSKLDMKGFTCGTDFSFGAGGVGNVEDLIAGIGGRYSVVDLCEINGEKVSTERVKSALSKGDLNSVRTFLGRDFSVVRKVIRGRSDGRKLGFPTINSDLMTVPLLSGVYFTDVSFDDRSYPSVTNVGAHPTFADMSDNIETYILDFEGDLYDKEITITFLSYHRAIKRYATVEELQLQIADDVWKRRKYD